MLIVTFLLFVWTTSCWFTQGMEQPLFGLPFLSIDVLWPFLALVIWSVVSGGIWIYRDGKSALDKARTWFNTNRRTAISLGLIVLLYIILQIPAIIMYRAVNDSDSAHYGIAGYHIAEGKERPMWFYGKHYNGTFSPHASALLDFLFGKQPAHLRIVNSMQYLGFLLFLFVIVRRLSDDGTALLAAALAAVPPYLISLFINNTYFASVMFFGSWGFFLLMRTIDNDKPSWRDYFWTGAVFGFGFFTHLQLIFFIVTALGVYLARDKFFILKPRFWAFIPGLLLGSIVTVIDCYYYDFIIFRRFFSQATEPRGLLAGFLDGATEFFKHVPDLLGINWYMGLPESVITILMPLVMSLVAVAIVTVIARNWRKLLNIFMFRGEKAGMLAFVLYFAVLFLLFSASIESTPPSPARYVAPIWFALVPIIAAALLAIPKKYYLRAAVVGLTFLLFGASHIAFDRLHADRENRLAAWEQFMRERNIDRFYGDFWVTYLCNFFTKEQIIGSCVPHLFEAYEPYYFDVTDDPGPTVYHFRSIDRHYRRTRDWLFNAGVTYDEVEAPFGIFFLNLSQRATVPQLYGLLKATYQAEIRNVEISHIAGSDGTNRRERILGITTRNTGKAEWLPHMHGAIVEVVMVGGQDNVLRRHHLGWRTNPGQDAEISTLLTEDELQQPDLRAQVRVNDIILAEQFLAELIVNVETSGSISISELSQSPDFLANNYAFFEGWLHWRTENGNLIRYAVDGTSSIGLFIEQPEDLQIAMVLAPFRYQRELTPVDIKFSLNGEPLDADMHLDRSMQVIIDLPSLLLHSGFNTLTLRYNVVEPAYDRQEGGSLVLRHRQRAFSINSMEVMNADTTKSAEAGR